MIRLAIITIVLSAAVVHATDDATTQPQSSLKILSGQPRLIVVNGYSTSEEWPGILQRKLDRFFQGRRVVEVIKAIKGSSPIAKWMDPDTGKPLEPWESIMRPALKAKADRPAIVLAQQSLQWAFGERQEGIRGTDDKERIQRGADVFEKYVRLAQADGAYMVFVAAHIYGQAMEPVLGNERLALAEAVKRGMPKFLPGPDVWQPTKDLFPHAFASDNRHPNAIGAEVMAQLWFETLLTHDGLAAPDWSKEEMKQAIAQPRDLSREVGNQALTSQPSTSPRAAPASRPARIRGAATRGEVGAN